MPAVAVPNPGGAGHFGPRGDLREVPPRDGGRSRGVTGRTVRVLRLRAKPPDVRDALAIGISQAGQSPDIVAAIDGAGRGGALALAVTNDETSPLARVADLVLPLRVGSERSIAATKDISRPSSGRGLSILAGAVAGAGPGAARALGQQTGESLAVAEHAMTGLSLGDGTSAIAVAGAGTR